MSDPSLPPRSHATAQLNYVIPHDLEALLARYCSQVGSKPAALIRHLISEFLKGELRIDVATLEHPKGRRTSLTLPERLLGSLEESAASFGKTKAAIIASLLASFLPPRVDVADFVRAEVDLPTEVFNQIYEIYGPGPLDAVIIAALRDLTSQRPVATQEG